MRRINPAFDWRNVWANFECQPPPLQNSLVRLNTLTGNATLVGSTGLRIIEADLAFNPLNELLYGIQDLGPTSMQRNFFGINPLTGVGTVIANLGVPADYSALAFSPSGILYTIETNGNTNSLLQIIDPLTGTITSSIATNVNLGDGVGLAIHPITNVAYLADGGFGGTDLLYTLDLTTGFLSPIGPTGVADGIAGLAFVTVPEPSSIWLAGIFGALGIARAKRKRQCQESEI